MLLKGQDIDKHHMHKGKRLYKTNLTFYNVTTFFETKYNTAHIFLSSVRTQFLSHIYMYIAYPPLSLALFCLNLSVNKGPSLAEPRMQ